MSKGLKALENIKREAGFPYFSTCYDADMWREDFATVEKELKLLEKVFDTVKAKYISAKQDYYATRRNLEEVDKTNRVLGQSQAYADIMVLLAIEGDFEL